MKGLLQSEERWRVFLHPTSSYYGTPHLIIISTLSKYIACHLLILYRVSLMHAMQVHKMLPLRVWRRLACASLKSQSYLLSRESSVVIG